MYANTAPVHVLDEPEYKLQPLKAFWAEELDPADWLLHATSKINRMVAPVSMCFQQETPTPFATFRAGRSTHVQEGTDEALQLFFHVDREIGHAGPPCQAPLAFWP